MLNFSCLSIKICNNLTSHSKTFMTMFIIYYENTWYDLEWANDLQLILLISNCRIKRIITWAIKTHI
jgi:hypothetical protein